MAGDMNIWQIWAKTCIFVLMLNVQDVTARRFGFSIVETARIIRIGIVLASLSVRAIVCRFGDMAGIQFALSSFLTACRLVKCCSTDYSIVTVQESKDRDIASAVPQDHPVS